MCKSLTHTHQEKHRPSLSHVLSGDWAQTSETTLPATAVMGDPCELCPRLAHPTQECDNEPILD